jgi:ubiquitin conjugation factor E4 B
MLGEQLATMLNYNIAQLCGPKCIDIKVKDAKERFKWDPRDLIRQIVEIYLNLQSEQFAELISQDEVRTSFSSFLSHIPTVVTFSVLSAKISIRFARMKSTLISEHLQAGSLPADFDSSPAIRDRPRE